MDFFYDIEVVFKKIRIKFFLILFYCHVSLSVLIVQTDCHVSIFYL